MSTHRQVLNIQVSETPLGMKWTLTMLDKTVAGGYAPNIWQALDDTNAALAEFAEKVGAK